MNGLYVASLWSVTDGVPILWWALWVGLAVLSIGLIVLMRTRWGQSEPLGKCLALSLLAHLLMAGYATTVQIVHSTRMIAQEHRVKLADFGGVDPAGDESGGSGQSTIPSKPWEVADNTAMTATDFASPEAAPAATTDLIATAPLEANYESFREKEPLPAVPRHESTIDAVSADQLVDRAQPDARSPAQLDTEIETAEPEQQAEQAVDAPQVDGPQPDLVASDQVPSDMKPGEPRSPLEPEAKPSAGAAPNLGQLTDSSGDRLADSEGTLAPDANDLVDPEVDAPPPILPDGFLSEEASQLADVVKPAPAPIAIKPSLDPAQDPAPPAIIPQPYQQRMSDRLKMAQEHGGSNETEQAVNAALEWLAKHQSPSGGWDATRHGAGQEKRVGGEDRHGAGTGADTGVTGLALLAMLGAGQTQLQGEHRECVRRGLEFLIRSQSADGHLAGKAKLFEKMYCHALATIALGEAYGLTADARLRPPLQRAIAFTLRCQHPSTGGWRYQPSEPGDTSQLGWQLMSLRSAELAGIAVPKSAKNGIARFLQTVASGNRGGLASYRPEDQATRSMTAEALVCRQFLGVGGDTASTGEAAKFILQEPPGGGQSNLYFWYYATLGLYQSGGSEWEQWNSALKAALLASQQNEGESAGSWNTDDVWGGYGGRVYTTAVGALCLEVYYRYLPLYGHPIARELNGKSLR